MKMKRLVTLLAGVGMLLSAAMAHAADSALSSEANAAYLANNARQPGVVVRPSGLQYRIIKSGYGLRPAAGDTVQVYYKGSLINGKQFDATEPGFPAAFKPSDLIPGWTEALELMREGDHWQLVIPSNLGYGTRGAGNGTIPPNQTLAFDLELLKVIPAPPSQSKDNQQGGGG